MARENILSCLKALMLVQERQSSYNSMSSISWAKAEMSRAYSSSKFKIPGFEAHRVARMELWRSQTGWRPCAAAQWSLTGQHAAGLQSMASPSAGTEHRRV